MTDTLLDPTEINRSNLREAMRSVLEYAEGIRRMTQSPSAAAQYVDLALANLRWIESQLAKPSAERLPAYSTVGAALVKAETVEIDERLVRLVAKVEDVYRRWYRNKDVGK